MFVSITLYITFVCVCARKVTSQPIAQTKYGEVWGESIPMASGRVINSYLGIPFAKPPVRSLRFEAPEEPDPWDEPFEATDLGNVCMQSFASLVQYTHLGWLKYDEDCLNLNIYSPQHDTGELLPVMVFIHGGGFSGGANIGYPGYFLAEHDVVAVAVNYRLGVFGYAYTGDDAVASNAGVLDVIQALTFIQENIESFGGDPNRVTIFGQSAGAAMAGLLIISPLAQGLFHGAILQSGTELSWWGVTKQEEQPAQRLLSYATSFDCPTDNTQDMVQCLRRISARRLQSGYVNCTTDYSCAMGPVVDGLVIPDDPLNLRKQGLYNHVPAMVGNTRDDSSVFTSALDFPNNFEYGLNRSAFDQNIYTIVSLNSENWPDPSRETDVYNAIRFYYADWPYLYDPKRNRDMCSDMYTDSFFGCPADLTGKYHSREDNVFQFIYSYEMKNSFFPDWLHAFHGSELPLIFGWPFFDENPLALNHSQANLLIPTNYTDFDKEFSTFMMELWTNFAKFGDPIPTQTTNPKFNQEEWVTLSEDNLVYYDIDREPALGRDYKQKECAFWTEYINYIIYGENSKGNVPQVFVDQDLSMERFVEELLEKQGFLDQDTDTEWEILDEDLAL